MAHADPFPVDALPSIAAAVGRRLTVLPGVPGDINLVQLAETFALWTLRAETLDSDYDATPDLERVASVTDRWHHQVRGEAGAFAFARSVRAGEHRNEWQVAEVFVSPLARRVDDAIDWIDAHISQDPVARLLVVPTLQVHAFWLHGDGTEQLVVVDAPAAAELESRRSYDPRTFLSICRAAPRIVGVKP